jgi:predicted AlkP superfamily pyrophosphatase or phosphodiesterase
MVFVRLSLGLVFISSVFSFSRYCLALIGIPIVSPFLTFGHASFKYKRVIVFCVDGLGAFGKKHPTPFISAFIENGSYTFNGETVFPSMSREAWGSMVHGVPPEIHKLNWQNEHWVPPDIIPSCIALVQMQFPGRRIGVFVNWPPFISGVWSQGARYDTFSVMNDESVTNRTIGYLEETDPVLLFIQLDNLDEIGHSKDYQSNEYFAALDVIDGQLSRIWAALERRNLLEDTLSMIVTDHGGIDHHHGGPTPEEMTIFFAVQGKCVARNRTIAQFNISDVAPIVTFALGVPPYSEWTARIPLELFWDARC